MISEMRGGPLDGFDLGSLPQVVAYSHQPFRAEGHPDGDFKGVIARFATDGAEVNLLFTKEVWDEFIASLKPW